MPEFYKDKVVLITGGSMGIGKEIARQALEKGSIVIITGRNEERLRLTEGIFKQYSERFMVYAGDVSVYDDNLKLVDEIIKRFGRLDIVISNAGLSAFGDLESTKPGVISEMIDTNIKGSVFLYNAVIPQLKKAAGSILFVSSLAGLRGLPSYSLYSLSKMALTSLTQSLRIETKKYNVFIGIVYAGFTRNEEEKRTYAPEGTLEKVPERNKFLVNERSETAAMILSQIRKRRNIKVHSFAGKCMFILNLYFPSVVRLLFEKNYKGNFKITKNEIPDRKI